MNIGPRVKNLHLPQDSFIVVGSGILSALGLRDSYDIDMIVSQEVFNRLKSDGWQVDTWGDQIVLKQDVFDVGTRWLGEEVEQLLPRAQKIEGIPYLPLDELRKWKQQMGRPKDQVDIKLIDAYLSKRSN